eukprot:CAMPEP_0117041436 /NCGR_PEP_ID=MMETSP0472-20121206/28937_1 /TAXON_ID=693140 ORGANISM="Tiarina fusus, Strain LIS" /NCGR_SAMPLE_ID=MMETSP0472 /ASSEMBLY_ACC=CAM_ASM_000603 /LENGTH=140 /DNA_ID=CAMNT_0004752445 /DNA_START=26 /DNA_END=448 /DNA_ORIENTATION=+
MGRVRTKTVKRSARAIVESYYHKLTEDFHTNKRVVDEVADLPSKRMRNKIAGFVTHLMRRIERGEAVRGVSLKLQEEERERRMDYIPDKSEIDTGVIKVDSVTKEMLSKLGLGFAGEIGVEDARRRAFGNRPAFRGPRRA